MKRIIAHILTATTLCVGALLAVGAAILAANLIERSSRNGVSELLLQEGLLWAKVSVDGLQVRLSGTAPDEAARFHALNLAGGIVDSRRVIDEIWVGPGEEVPPPKFAIEMLRDDSGISLVGLTPAATDRDAIRRAIARIAGDAALTDLLESANYPVPDGWEPALAYALRALDELPRSKISVSPGRVEIAAAVDSQERMSDIEVALAEAAPEGVALALDISTPRRVIAPYTLRFVIDDSGARFDACTANSEAGRDRILAAATEAGIVGQSDCELGLGAPSPHWSEAAITAIAALERLGGGAVTFSDADVSLVARDDAPDELFDSVVGDLAADLPEAFSLTAVQPGPKEGEDDAEPIFISTLSPEGLLHLRGLVPDERRRLAVEGFARGLFSSASVRSVIRIEDGLPEDLVKRIFAGLEGLAELHSGSLAVRADVIEIRGASHRNGANAEISRILSARLDAGANFSLEVRHEARPGLPPGTPSDRECAGRMAAILQTGQVTFAPGSADIDSEGIEIIDRIADAMEDCVHVPMEVGGHTDSQGSEELNQGLSQRRAESVLAALTERRILTGNLKAVGYGETRPIADNATEEGRIANRRIEFLLIETKAADGDGGGNAEEDGGGDSAVAIESENTGDSQ